MPIIAIGAAAFAASTIAAGVATAGSFAAWAAAESFAAISAVGAITSAVGVVTGNEKLAKIGGVAALVGGVGAIGQSSGWWGDGATSALETSSSSLIDTPTSNAPVEDPSSGLNKAFDTTSPSTLQGANSPSGLNPLSDTTSPSTLGTPSIGNGAPLAMPDAPTNLRAATNPSGGLIGQGTATDGAAFINTNKPFSFMEKIDSIGGWMDKNKMLSMGAMNAIGSMFDESKKFQLEQAKRMATNQNSIPSLAGYGINSNKIPTLQPGLINRS